MKANRLEAFSDGVIAIIITIMVLDLRIPKDASLASLLSVLPVFLCYALSFLIVAIYWVNHHHLIHSVRNVDGRILWANNNLLFWMSLIPFATGYLGETHAARLPVVLYCLLGTAAGLSYHLLAYCVACLHRFDSDFMALRTKRSLKNFLGIGLNFAAAGVAFISIPVALAMVMLPPLMFFMPDFEAIAGD